MTGGTPLLIKSIELFETRQVLESRTEDVIWRQEERERKDGFQN
jgi:hypothetical protein